MRTTSRLLIVALWGGLLIGCSSGDEFADKKGKMELLRKEVKPTLLTRTCPPGLALASPDMSKIKHVIKFRMFGSRNDFLM